MTIANTFSCPGSTVDEQNPGVHISKRDEPIQVSVILAKLAALSILRSMDFCLVTKHSSLSNTCQVDCLIHNNLCHESLSYYQAMCYLTAAEGNAKVELISNTLHYV